MVLSEKQKKIEDEGEYGTKIKEDLNPSSKQKSKKCGAGCLTAIIIFIAIVAIGIVFSSSNTPTPNSTDSGNQLSFEADSSEQSVLDIEVNGRTISVGDAADSVFAIITDEYKVDSPTIQEGEITHHFLDGKILFDMTFERNKAGDYYILSKIVIKDTKYQVSNQQKTLPPIQYTIGYTSGALAAIVTSKGTTNDELVGLLNYFHNLHKKGDFSKTMRGHTTISIFDDESWATEDSYERIIRDETYCDYIKATYSIDNSGVERAFIGDWNCPSYEKIIF
ncbi:MAG: hypothetical protein Q8P29_01830 [Candidatus Levybacteria bacterium]|nr:hypothetical protein [Candidatus Levybacteria bacterium]